ncbi:MAG TPA: peptidoglycan DD-metalloendopeptidase family protein [Coprothermobacter proteolyticus]|nr:peptidoglycan DD-metalloendopeptidase family protein [Coprothermobacter proteolyticus]
MKPERLSGEDSKAVILNLVFNQRKIELHFTRRGYRWLCRTLLVMFLVLGVTFFHVQQSKGLAALTLQKQDVQQTKELVEQYQAEMALLQQQNELLMKFKEEQMQQLEKKLQDVVNTAADTLKKPSLKNLVASAAGPTAYRGTDDIDKEIQSLQAKMDEVEKTLEKYADALNAFPDKWPTWGNITSTFGWRRWSSGWVDFHTGLDIANSCGTPVYAAGKGVVIQAGRDGSYGLSVIISHGNGYTTRYAHLSSIAVKVGQTVLKGDYVGAIGQTGFATGCHLHFEVKLNGTLIDPYKVLP